MDFGFLGYMAGLYVSHVRGIRREPYSQKRFEQRNLSFKEALQVLEKRDLSYPPDEEGRQKIRSKISGGKSAFLVVSEDNRQIVIITGGEA